MYIRAGAVKRQCRTCVPHDWEETKAYFTAEARRLLAAGLAS
jgi:hypothetical protein